MGPHGAKAIVEGPWELEALDLSNNQLNDAALQAIAASKRLSKLTALKLGAGAFEVSQLGPKGAGAFLEALTLPKLTTLSLTNTGLGDAGAKALAASKRTAS